MRLLKFQDVIKYLKPQASKQQSILFFSRLTSRDLLTETDWWDISHVFCWLTHPLFHRIWKFIIFFLGVQCKCWICLYVLVNPFDGFYMITVLVFLLTDWLFDWLGWIWLHETINSMELVIETLLSFELQAAAKQTKQLPMITTIRKCMLHMSFTFLSLF